MSLARFSIEYALDESLLNADAISSKTALTLDAKTRFIPYAALGLVLVAQQTGPRSGSNLELKKAPDGRSANLGCGSHLLAS